MLNLYLYQHSSQVLGLDFLESLPSREQKVLFVAPSPVQTDILREKVVGKNSNTEVITISQFTKECLKNFPEQLNYLGKSDALLNLAAVWRHFFADYGIEYFLRSYNLFTDLRSYTLNIDIVQTVLEEFDPVMAKAIGVFYQVMQQQDWADEHKAYFSLSEQLRSQDWDREYADSIIVFWGFRFLSGSQVDFIKSLGIRNQVVVPLAKSVFEKSLDSDWIKWLCDNKTQYIEASDYNKSKCTQLNALSFPKNHLATYFNQIKDILPTDRSIGIFLGNRSIAVEEALEIPAIKSRLKTNVSLFDNELYQFEIWLLGLEITQAAQIKEAVLLKGREYSCESNFRAFKVCSVFLMVLQAWRDLSDSHEDLDKFSLQALLEVCSLRMPRNSLINFSKDIGQYYVESIDKIETAREHDFRIIIASSAYQGLATNVVGYSEGAEKYLASIGPIRRSELEFETLKTIIRENLSKDNCFLLMEPAIVEHDLSWNNLLEGIEINEIPFNPNLEFKGKYYDFSVDEKYLVPEARVSASSFQLYLDCPKKYYYSRMEKISPKVELKETLQKNQLGSLEHKVIEDYLTQNTLFDEAKHSQLALLTLKQHLAAKEINLNAFDFKIAMSEILHYSRRGIEAILLLSQFSPKSMQHFEFGFKHAHSSGYQKHGSIDYYAQGENLQILIDFKRSSSSIPQKKDILEYRKIQLWFYLNTLKEASQFNLERKFLVGYMNLSDISSSYLVTNDEELFSALKGSTLFINAEGRTPAINLYDEKWDDSLQSYTEFEADKLVQMRNDKSFIISPIDENACRYCDFATICPRGEL